MRALRRSYEGWRADARALYAYAEERYLQCAARSDPLRSTPAGNTPREPPMHTPRFAPLVVAVAVAAQLAACSDSLNSPLEPSSTRTSTDLPGFPGLGDFQRFVAIGTSVTMGVQSDGVYS